MASGGGGVAQQLFRAAKGGKAAKLQRLLAQASSQQRRDLLQARNSDFYNFTALHFAACRGHEQCVTVLLDAATAGGADDGHRELLLARDATEETAVHEAALNGHGACLAALLARAGAGEERREVLFAKNARGKTVLEVAQEYSSFANHAVLALLQKEPMVTADAQAAVQVAVEGGSMALLHGAMGKVGAADEHTSRVMTLNRMAEVVLEAAVNEGSLATLRASVAKAEAVGVDESDLEVARKLLELLRRAAEAALEAATAGGSIQSLQAAIRGAEAAGLRTFQVEAAQQAALALQRKADADDALKAPASEVSCAAVGAPQADAEGVDQPWPEEARKRLETLRKEAEGTLEAAALGDSILTLQAAIRLAEAAELPDGGGRQLGAARKALDALRRRAGARAALAEALGEESAASLRAAVLEADDAGVDASDVQPARRLLALQQAAEATLGAAMAGGDAWTLRLAAEQAKAAGVHSTHIEAAQHAAQALHHKATAKTALRAAAAERSAAALRAAMPEPRNEGCRGRPDDPELAMASWLLEVLRRLAEAELEAAVQAEDIPLLQAAIPRAEAAGVRNSQVEVARDLEVGLRRRATAGAALQVAITGTDVGLLQAAMTKAMTAGVQAPQLAAAWRRVAILQREDEASLVDAVEEDENSA